MYSGQEKNMKKIARFIPSLTIKELISALLPTKEKYGICDPLQVFAEEFAQYINVRYAIPSPSARVALAGILHALALPEGKEVILPSLTFHCVPAMFQKFGLQPRFVDVDPQTYCIDVNRIEAAITQSTAAIVPVHLYGRACNMDAICQIAQRHNLTIIEDCAQSCGALYSGKPLGSFGNAAFFSFHTHKNISVLGSGMAVTDSPELAAKISSWMKQFPPLGAISLAKQLLYVVGARVVTRPWVWSTIVYTILKICDSFGFNLIEALTSESPDQKEQDRQKSWFMPGKVHGRIGLGQLEKLNDLNNKRISLGDKLLKDLKEIPGITLPVPLSKNENIYASFPVQVKDRQRFKQRLFNLGVDSHMGNMSVGPYLPGLKDTGEYKIASQIVSQIVHLPVYPDMDEMDVSKIIKAVTTALSRKENQR